MERVELERVAEVFAAFHQEFAGLFGRKEAQRRSEQYLRGLLVQQTDRRNAENVAETIEGATPRTLQRLLTEAPWTTEPVIDQLQAYLGPRLNTTAGVFVLDESGFPKQGKHSVGVARQYCGALGKVGNCQMGVFLAYASARGQALVDMRLFLPAVWTEDVARCRAAGVPVGTDYQSKAALGLAMLRHARAVGHLVGHWVAGDDAYGMVPTLRDALDAEDWHYVLDVPKTTPPHQAASGGTGVARADRRDRGRRPAARCVAGTDRGGRRSGATHLSLRGTAGVGMPRRAARTRVLAAAPPQPGWQ